MSTFHNNISSVFEFLLELKHFKFQQEMGKLILG